MIDVKKIIHLQNINIIEWHNQLIDKEIELPWKFIEENNRWNFCLWHEEDIARIEDIEFEKIVSAKRNIDKYNQARNNAMEKIDEWILSQLLNKQIQQDLPLHSETPGMMIDRLSIMALKKYHMQDEVNRVSSTEEHKINCRIKVTILQEQINDLASCLEGVLGKLIVGELRFKVYRQFKMYNDPNLNPQLYSRKND